MNLVVTNPIPASQDSSVTADASADENAIDRLNSLMTDDLKAVNALIVERMASDVAMIPALASYLVQSGGKRLRPLITLAAAKICGYEGQDHRKLAATVEFIHTATLLHDDVVDESTLRRGQESANVVWGNQASVLVGDFLFSRAFNLMVEVGDLKTLDILSSASSIIAEGEVQQLANTSNINVSKETYLEIITSKTAALFEAAARVGGVISKRPEHEELALQAYGRSLGIAFQLVDDALDYSGRQAELGKTIGDDFREGKLTLPVILAFAGADDEEQAFWRRTIEFGEQKPGDLSRAIQIIETRDTLRRTLRDAERYVQSAKDALAVFPASAYKTALLDVASFCIDRAY